MPLLSEFELISRLTGQLRQHSPRVLCGIGDDAAVLETSAERLLLATCDSQIAGVHFVAETMAPEAIGRRTAAVNLSDIAAMGGVPTFALVSLSLPDTTTASWLEALYQGLDEELGRFGALVVGGNTARLPERLVLDLTLLGEVERDRVLLRSGACEGDLLCVTGVLGGSAAGLAALLDPTLDLPAEDRQAAIARHTGPQPRIAVGRLLGACGWVTSCIDVSDGLLGDVHHLAQKSRIRIVIDADLVPIAAPVYALCRLSGADPAVYAATSGEEYELLFTVRRRHAQEIAALVLEQTGMKVTVIGEVVAGPPGVAALRDGKELSLVGVVGFDHFKKA